VASLRAPDLTGRTDSLTALAEREFDLLVIGAGDRGGDASARRGTGWRSRWSTEATSAGRRRARRPLIHGGLRYLRLGDVRLVREAHEERRHLMNVVAPHLVHQIPFLLPLYERGPYRPFAVQTGIAIYSTLARARLNGLVDPARARRMNPDLRLGGLRKCGLYVDCRTNDSRLTLANVRSAADGERLPTTPLGGAGAPGLQGPWSAPMRAIRCARGRS
jgi:glycerol-3-phosphate dehydrogenase